MGNFIIEEHEHPLRLDKILSLRFPDHSRTYFQYLIDGGQVLINGRLPKKKDKTSVGDSITVTFLASPDPKVTAENIPLDILYEDDYIIAIHKPRGMVVHPGAGNPSGTLVNAL